MDSTILVTGGAGFIGSHLVQHLLTARDERVLIVDRFDEYYDPRQKRANVTALASQPRVSVAEADVNDCEKMLRLLEQHQVRAIVHLAASPGVAASLQDPLAHVGNNIGGLLSMLEAARQRPVERFLFTSSSSVYGRGAQAPFVEDATLGIPLSPYAAAKRSGELLGLMYWQVHGVRVTSLRLFNVYGPRLRPDMALSIFTRAVLEERPLPLYGDGSIRRDFTHVADVCRGLLAALEAPQAIGQCINLGSDHPVSVVDLISLIARAAGRKARLDHRPPRAKDMPFTHADLSKARRLLAYEPCMPLEQGVAEYVRWFEATRDGSAK